MSIAPPQASTFAGAVDSITLSLLVLSAAILTAVFGLITYFGIRYRSGSARARRRGSLHPSWFEWSWTLATLVIFVGIYAWSATVYFEMHSPPAGAEEITVVAKQWMWKFQHEDGRRELGELHVAAGRPTLLTMTSQDVIHSLFVPAFRIKQDVLPGRYERLWFQPTRPGRYDIFCTQYCGTAHSGMRAQLVVLGPAEYARWLETGVTRSSPQGAGSRVSQGRELYSRMGCVHCHAPGSGIRCPDLHGIYGKPVLLTEGSTVIADDDYLRESIAFPSAKIVAGFDDIMPSFRRQASEEDILNLIAYIKSMSAEPEGAPHHAKTLPQ